MGRGILSGLIWGSIISVFVLSAVSLLAPLPQRPGEGGEDLASVAPGPDTAAPSEQPDTPPATDAPATPEPETGTTAPATTEPEATVMPEAGTTATVTPEPERPAPAARQTIGEAVSVPAGSEFRRPPPETEAALPTADPTSPVAGAPAVPPSDAAEGGLELPSTESAARPDTPGMSVTAPVAPVVNETEPEVTAPAAGAVTSRPAGEPLGPVSSPSEDASLPLDDRALPPPVTPEAVASDPIPGAGEPAETLAASESGQAEAVVAAGAVPRDTAAEEGLAPVAAEGVTSEAAASATQPEVGVATATTAAGAAQPTEPAATATIAAGTSQPSEPVATETIAADTAQPSEPIGGAEVPPAVADAAPTSRSEQADAVSPVDVTSAAPVAPGAATPVESDGVAAETIAQAPVPEGADAVPASPETAVAGAEPAPAAEGEQLAMAEPAPDLPGAVDAERLGDNGPLDAATPSDAADALPATAPDALPEAGTVPDRPERKEIQRSEPGEAAPEVGDEAPSVPGVRVLPLTDRSRGSSRLPQIGREPEAEEVAVSIDDPGASPDATAPDAADGGPTLGALSRYSVPFANPEGKPLFSVILIDDGSRTLDRQVLSTFTFPVTFAIDPALPDAAEAAEFYRSAGFEVVALATGVTPDATARDLEVTMEANLAAVPQAVAIMDPANDGIGGRRALVEHAVEIAAGDGLGLIGWDRGLGAVRAASERAGHPAALIFRSVDDQGERSTVIQRYLDRAAFKAVQDGAVVMAGHANPETVEALFSWVLADKAREVALAPVSAVLRR